MKKRIFEEISKPEEENKETENYVIYGGAIKRRRIEQQKVGELIVSAKKAFNFKIGIYITNQIL